jgi:hypothetical protein
VRRASAFAINSGETRTVSTCVIRQRTYEALEYRVNRASLGHLDPSRRDAQMVDVLAAAFTDDDVRAAQAWMQTPQ